MASAAENDWESGEKSGLVSVGTHKLFVSVSGPARKAGEPIVLISFGGILGREFLAHRPKDVVPLCLVDTNSERTYVDRAVPDYFFEVMMQGIDYHAVTGLNDRHNMTSQEWQTLMDAEKTDADQEYSGMEWQYFQSNSDALAVHKQCETQVLGKYPVSVVKGNTARDMRKIADVAIEKGNGTKEQQDEMLKVLATFDETEEKLQRDQLRLSSNSRYVYAAKSGHSVQCTEPELIAGEVKWILETYAQMEQ